ECLEIILNSGRHLMVIINDILDLSKIEAGQVDLEWIDFNLFESLDSVVQIMRHQVQKKGLSFNLEIHPGVPASIKGDPARIKQVVLNLVANAVKFTEQGGISVKVDLFNAWNSSNKNGPRLLFSVADTGIGIEPEKKTKIFDSFVQADSSVARKYGGTGLGLTISRQLVELMGGTMWVQSEVGKGSTFYFTVPVERGIEGEKQRQGP
ncbi:MAG: ATP-binding protein, partial [Spirochaetota bacterium]